MLQQGSSASVRL